MPPPLKGPHRLTPAERQKSYRERKRARLERQVKILLGAMAHIETGCLTLAEARATASAALVVHGAGR